MPTCTLPGQQGSASLGDDEEDAVDNGAVIGEMIESELAGAGLSHGVTHD